jgi:hypothetical protein
MLLSYMVFNNKIHSNQILEDGSICAGARHEGEGLDLHVRWDDGFDAWIFHTHVKEQEHCLRKMVDFYETKTRKKRSSSKA